MCKETSHPAERSYHQLFSASFQTSSFYILLICVCQVHLLDSAAASSQLLPQHHCNSQYLSLAARACRNFLHPSCALSSSFLRALLVLSARRSSSESGGAHLQQAGQPHSTTCHLTIFILYDLMIFFQKFDIY